MKKDNTIKKFIELGASLDTANNIYDFIYENQIERYLRENFEPTEKSKNNWIPVFELLDFLKKEKPLIFENISSNSFGREMSKIGVVSGYRHYPKKGSPCSGYYVKISDNIIFYKLSKFLKND